MSRFRAMMKTTAARLSALYLMLFTICALVLVFYMTVLPSAHADDTDGDAINEEVESLGQAYQRGGIVGLVRTIDRRARQPGANLYLVSPTPTAASLPAMSRASRPAFCRQRAGQSAPITLR